MFRCSGERQQGKIHSRADFLLQNTQNTSWRWCVHGSCTLCVEWSGWGTGSCYWPMGRCRQPYSSHWRGRPQGSGRSGSSGLWRYQGWRGWWWSKPDRRGGNSGSRGSERRWGNISVCIPCDKTSHTQELYTSWPPCQAFYTQNMCAHPSCTLGR